MTKEKAWNIANINLKLISHEVQEQRQEKRTLSAICDAKTLLLACDELRKFIPYLEAGQELSTVLSTILAQELSRDNRERKKTDESFFM